MPEKFIHVIHAHPERSKERSPSAEDAPQLLSHSASGPLGSTAPPPPPTPATTPNVTMYGDFGGYGSSGNISNSNGDICRICHCETDPGNPLMTPCYCSGSLKYVHQGCLQQWLAASGTRTCELCKFGFILHTKIKPISEWRRLEMSSVERRRLLCAILFHFVAAVCVVWSLFVLIDRAAEEVQLGKIAWPFWTKLVVVAVGFTGGAVFMYIQCRQYLHLFSRWKAHNRIILVQNAPEKQQLPPPSPTFTCTLARDLPPAPIPPSNAGVLESVVVMGGAGVGVGGPLRGPHSGGAGAGHKYGAQVLAKVDVCPQYSNSSHYKQQQSQLASKQHEACYVFKEEEDDGSHSDPLANYRIAVSHSAHPVPLAVTRTTAAGTVDPIPGPPPPTPASAAITSGGAHAPHAPYAPSLGRSSSDTSAPFGAANGGDGASCDALELNIQEVLALDAQYSTNPPPPTSTTTAPSPSPAPSPRRYTHKPQHYRTEQPEFPRERTNEHSDEEAQEEAEEEEEADLEPTGVRKGKQQRAAGRRGGGGSARDCCKSLPNLSPSTENLL